MAIRDLDASARIARARSALITGAPFYAALLLHQELVERPSIKTMAVDGRRLIYAPDFVRGLNEPELIGVLIHEVSHLALCHHTRRGSRDPEMWNIACDEAINSGIIAAGFALPADMYNSPEFRGQPAELIYSTLAGRKPKPEEQGQDGKGGQGAGQGAPQPGQDGKPGQDKAQGQGAGQDAGQGQPGAGQGAGAGAGQDGKAAPDPGRCGGVIDAAPDAAGNAAEAARMESIVRQAIAVSVAAAGEMPGDLGRIMGELNRPRIPWRETVDRFVDNAAQSVTSWNRPDKRFLESGFFMPGRQRHSVSALVAFLDTSGSCNDAHVAAFGSEVQAILDTGRVERLHVVYVDSKVQGWQDFEAGDVVNLEPRGGGGTRFDVAWDHMRSHCPDAAAAIYLTDLDSKHFGRDPGIPVLWCVQGTRTRAPFGEVIPLDPFA